MLSCIQLRAEREFKAKNGPLDCVQKNYLLSETPSTINTRLAEDFANRLRKNEKNSQNGQNNSKLSVIAYMMLIYQNIMLR
ncbi:hypothetical protein I3679_010550 [Proteus mirabilis]|uniref:Uncharacterized protein n=1 Tax=Proteus mirabilis TaxID=584 RepID=A0ABD5LWD7_PROMI